MIKLKVVYVVSIRRVVTSGNHFDHVFVLATVRLQKLVEVLLSGRLHVTKQE